LKYVCILRWASHLQTLPGLKDNLPRVPVPERSYEVPRALNKPQQAVESKAPVQKIKEETKAPKKQQAKKEAKPKEENKKEETKKEETKKPAAKKEKKETPQESKEGEDPFQFLDLRVGRVERV